MSMKLLATILLCAGCLRAAAGTNEIQLAVGQTYSLHLDSNPTTGYRWSLVSPANQVVVLVTNSYEPSAHKAGLVGFGGMEHWTFKAVGQGRTELVLEYARSWEKVAVRKTNVVVVCK
jgi:inhibitor of cysteine peptidase